MLNKILKIRDLQPDVAHEPSIPHMFIPPNLYFLGVKYLTGTFT